jgi:hypothetical protein
MTLRSNKQIATRGDVWKSEQARGGDHVLALTPTTGATKMVEAKPKSYKERMREARAKREAEKAEWLRQITLVSEIRRMSLEAMKASIRDRGDRVTLYTPAQLRAQADAMIGPWLVAKAEARIAERKSKHLSNSQNAV